MIIIKNIFNNCDTVNDDDNDDDGESIRCPSFRYNTIIIIKRDGEKKVSQTNKISVLQGPANNL